MKSQINVILITSRSDIGGGPKHVFELSKFLSPKLVLSVCSPLTPPYGSAFNGIGEDHIYCPHRKFSFKTFYKLLLKGLHDRNTIFHSHGRGAGIYTKALSLLGFKCVHTFHGVHQSNSLKGKLKLFFDKLFSYYINHFIAVSPDELEISLHLGLSNNSNSLVIPNKFLPTNNRKASSTSILNLGILSRLDPHKNNIEAVNNFILLQQENPNLKLLIGGDGPEKAELQKLCDSCDTTDSITLLGEIKDITNFFDKIDLLVSFSKGEGLPYVILEAFDNGVPCLVSDVPGHTSLVSPNYRFKLGNFNSFRAKFEKIKNDQDIVIQEQYRILKDFSSEKTEQRILKLYQEI